MSKKIMFVFIISIFLILSIPFISIPNAETIKNIEKCDVDCDKLRKELIQEAIEIIIHTTFCPVGIFFPPLLLCCFGMITSSVNFALKLVKFNEAGCASVLLDFFSNLISILSDLFANMNISTVQSSNINFFIKDNKCPLCS